MWVMLALLQAEELFAKMEERLLKAKELKIVFETKIGGREYTGTIGVRGERVSYAFDAVKFESDTLRRSVLTIFARGCAGIADYEAVRGKAPPELKPAKLRLGPKKDRLQRVDFDVDSGAMIGTYSVSLWIDTKTHLPVEREFRQGDTATTEKYTVTAPADRR